jgi:hypothetical protein
MNMAARHSRDDSIRISSVENTRDNPNFFRDMIARLNEEERERKQRNLNASLQQEHFLKWWQALQIGLGGVIEPRHDAVYPTFERNEMLEAASRRIPPLHADGAGSRAVFGSPNGQILTTPQTLTFRSVAHQGEKKEKFTMEDAFSIAFIASQSKEFQKTKTIKLDGPKDRLLLIQRAIESMNEHLPEEQRLKVANPVKEPLFNISRKRDMSFADFIQSAPPLPQAPNQSASQAPEQQEPEQQEPQETAQTNHAPATPSGKPRVEPTFDFSSQTGDISATAAPAPFPDVRPDAQKEPEETVDARANDNAPANSVDAVPSEPVQPAQEKADATTAENRPHADLGLKAVADALGLAEENAPHTQKELPRQEYSTSFTMSYPEKTNFSEAKPFGALKSGSLEEMMQSGLAAIQAERERLASSQKLSISTSFTQSGFAAKPHTIDYAGVNLQEHLRQTLRGTFLINTDKGVAEVERGQQVAYHKKPDTPLTFKGLAPNEVSGTPIAIVEYQKKEYPVLVSQLIFDKPAGPGPA